MPRRRSPDGAPAAAQRRGGTTLTPTSGNPPSGGEEEHGPRPANARQRSSANATHASFNNRGTLAGSHVLRPPAESAEPSPGNCPDESYGTPHRPGPRRSPSRGPAVDP